MRTKKIISILLTIVLLLSANISAFAENSDLDSYQEDGTLFITKTSIHTKIYGCIDDYNVGVYENVDAVFGDMKLDMTGSAVDVELAYAKSSLSFTGMLYFVGEKTNSKNCRIVGNFQKAKGFKIIQFESRKSTETGEFALVLLIEDEYSGALMEQSYLLSQNQFDSILKESQKNTDKLVAIANEQGEDPRLAVYPELLTLLMPSKMCMSEQNTNGLRAQSNYTFKSTTYYSAVSADYEDDLEPFFDDLNDLGEAYASTKMNSILTQTGWKFYRNSDMFYVMHGVTNSSTERLVGITVAAFSSEKVPGSPQVKAAYTILHSITLSYDTVNDKADVLYYDAGIRLEDATVAVELTGGTTNFHYAQRSQGLDGDEETLNILFAISDHLNIASAIWNALTPDPVVTSDNVDYGDDTYQDRIYRGHVRATGNCTDNGTYLWSEGNNLSIMGTYYSNKIYSSYRYAFGFKAYSLL